MALSVVLLITSVNTLLTTSYIILFLNVGLNTYESVLLAFLITLSSNLLGGLNLRVGNIVLSDELRKASVIKLRGNYLVQSLRFKPFKNITVELNLGGALVPLIVSILILTYIVSYYGVIPLLITSLLITSATLIINRVSIVIKGLGLAVPVLIVSVIVSLLSLIMDIITGLCKGLSIHYSYLVAYTSVLLGVDLMNINKVSLYDARKLIIGGLKLYDALSLMPATSTVITYIVITIINTYLNAFIQ
ncbi:MAG: DUF1614 domain-containing protein [Sulfolobales archaeon]